jgi:arachidonate 15-lipoxygenase
VPEYIISQRDPRGERTEQLAAVKAAHTYNMEYGFPVSTGPDDNGPSRSWQFRAIEEQELIRANLVAMRHHGKWDFVNDLQPLAPRRLAKMVHEADVGGLLDYFMPVPGGVKDRDRARTLKEFRTIFEIIQPPDVVDRSESDEYFAEMMVAGPDPTRLTRLDAVPDKFPITTEHLHSVPELPRKRWSPRSPQAGSTGWTTSR